MNIIPQDLYGRIKFATAVAAAGFSFYIAANQYRQLRKGLNGEENEQHNTRKPIECNENSNLTLLSSSSSSPSLLPENRNLASLSDEIQNRPSKSDEIQNLPSTSDEIQNLPSSSDGIQNLPSSSSSSPLNTQEDEAACGLSSQISNHVEQFPDIVGPSKYSIGNGKYIIGLTYATEQEKQASLNIHDHVSNSSSNVDEFQTFHSTEQEQKYILDIHYHQQDLKFVDIDEFQTSYSTEKEQQSIHNLNDCKSVEIDEFQVVPTKVVPTRGINEVITPSENGFEPAEIQPVTEAPSTKRKIMGELHISPCENIYISVADQAKYRESQNVGCSHQTKTHTSPESKKIMKNAKAKVNEWLANIANFTPINVSMLGIPLSIVDVPGDSSVNPPKKNDIMKKALKYNKRRLAASRYESLLRNPNIQRLRQFGGYLNSSEWPVCKKHNEKTDNL